MAVGLGLLSVVIFLLRSPSEKFEPIRLDESARLSSCREKSLELAKPERVDVTILNQLSNLCYNEVRGEDLLGDFNIRRSNIIKQQFEGQVILWMVVSITVSGVVLAGLQLMAAYRLASSSGRDLDGGGVLTLEQNRISLKSSVTGLLILTISFAFFMVYVIWVYTLRDYHVDVEAGQIETSQAATQTSANAQTTPSILNGVGQLGSPPIAGASVPTDTKSRTRPDNSASQKR